ncbi:MAG: hypothetical protein K2X37_04090 [Chitinophagaceae bacterium]|nr:hypothetical protein [Chitinophagaceae bacterium]
MYKVSIICLFVFSLLNNNTYAQASNTGLLVGKWDQQMVITDMNGRPFKSSYDDVKGSPYLRDSFNIGTILLSNGTKINHILLRVDLCNQSVQFKAQDGQQLYVGASEVIEVNYEDVFAENASVKLRTHFPPVDFHKANEFFEVLSEGSITLLKSTTKRIDIQKHGLSGEISKEFITYIDYYVLKEAKMIRLKHDKDFIRGIFSDKTEKMEAYLHNYKKIIRQEADLINIFNYYNM